MSYAEKAAKFFPRMVELRRAFHRHPELAFEEEHTARGIIQELKRLGLGYTYAGKGSAVIGRLRDGRMPTIALRAEMDALPATENTDLPFASAVAGKMHASGHDVHMAMVLGAAAMLAESPPEGNVLFVFQPAEERGGGARVVLNSGALDGVAAVFGGQVTHHYRVGEIMVADGLINAKSDRFAIHVKGRGGRGVRPHEAADAVVIASMLIGAIQTMVSREIDPIHPSVVTIGRLEAGSAPDVIAECAVIEGTIRTTLREVRAHLHKGLERIANSFAELHDACIDVDINTGYPPVVNTKHETQICYRAAREVVGDQGLMRMDHPSMGSEDFSCYLKEMPGCYVRIGARAQENQYVPLHSPEFDVDEEVMKVGAVYFDTLARHALLDYTRSLF